MAGLLIGSLGEFGSIGSAVTFPAGSVIKRQVNRVRQSGHLNTATAAGWIRIGNTSVAMTYTPKSTSSSLILEYTFSAVHSSGASYGYYAFTKGTGDRNPTMWDVTGYSDGDGHFWAGDNQASAVFYMSVHGVLKIANTSVSSFTLDIDVKSVGGTWYYAHSGGYHHLSVTEIE